MKICLLDPAPKASIIEPYEHLGLGYLTSILRLKGCKVEMISTALENLSIRKTVRRIQDSNPDLVGISVKGVNANRTVKIVELLRAMGFRGHITIGGHFPTFHHEEILRGFPTINSVVRGEGEYVLGELVETLGDKDFDEIQSLSYRDEEGVKINPPRKLIENLDSLPFPVRDHTPHVLKNGGIIGIAASRGCYARCAFCSVANFYGKFPGRKWRVRSAQNVVEEIEFLIRKFGCSLFKFIDDQPIFSNAQYAEQLKNELNRRNLSIKFQMNCRANNIEKELFQTLKTMGLQKVFVGIESAHQRGLDTLQKGTTVAQNNEALRILDELDIDYTVGFILIDPYTTYQELNENLKYLSSLKSRLKGRNCCLSVSTMLTVHGDTPIFYRLLKEGRLQGNYLEGFSYPIEDKNVRRFRFVMESVVEKRLLPFYHKALSFLGQVKRKNQMSSDRFHIGRMVASYS